MVRYSCTYGTYEEGFSTHEFATKKEMVACLKMLPKKLNEFKVIRYNYIKKRGRFIHTGYCDLTSNYVEKEVHEITIKV